MATKSTMVVMVAMVMATMAVFTTATADSAHVAEQSVTIPSRLAPAARQRVMSTSNWLLNSLYYSSDCTPSSPASFVDGTATNLCLISPDQPGQSFFYTCDASSYTAVTYSGVDCNPSQVISSVTSNYQCTPYSQPGSLLASSQMSCQLSSTAVLPATYIINQDSFSSSCADSFEFNSILNRACAAYPDQSSTYSVFYDYPYAYTYSNAACAGNYTSASFIGQNATCGLQGTYGYNQVYFVRSLGDEVAASSGRPTLSPTHLPTLSPTHSLSPTQGPTQTPTLTPSLAPSASPSTSPSAIPSAEPSAAPTAQPSVEPSQAPSVEPTVYPSQSPTVSPSVEPSRGPTHSPTVSPSVEPTRGPTHSPTVSPSVEPTVGPTHSPTVSPSVEPTRGPTHSPTASPSVEPTVGPTHSPTASPSEAPTMEPTQLPSLAPTVSPTHTPTLTPTLSPSLLPTPFPVTPKPTSVPTNLKPPAPSRRPTMRPSVKPTRRPTARPSRKPTRTPTRRPSRKPSLRPSRRPTRRPSRRPTCRYTSSISMSFTGTQSLSNVASTPQLRQATATMLANSRYLRAPRLATLLHNEKGARLASTAADRVDGASVGDAGVRVASKVAMDNGDDFYVGFSAEDDYYSAGNEENDDSVIIEDDDGEDGEDDHGSDDGEDDHGSDDGEDGEDDHGSDNGAGDDATVGDDDDSFLDADALTLQDTIAQLCDVEMSQVSVNSFSSAEEVVATHGHTASLSSTVVYTISLSNVQAMGYASGQEAYDAVTSKLSAALSDGSFTETLHANAERYDSSALMGASSSAATFSQPTIDERPLDVDSTTASPALSTEAKVGIALTGAFLVAMLVFAGVYYYRRKMLATQGTASIDATGAPSAPASEMSESVNPMSSPAQVA